MSSDRQSIAPHVLRDLANGLQQQMFFWGQDVVRPEGNLLVEQGFSRSPSRGLKGTSCYRREWQGGHVELYGSCAGWYGEERGFAFIRPRKQCVVWKSAEDTPVPGSWRLDLIDRSASREQVYQASLPFLDWLISYEVEVLSRFGADYRMENYRRYKKVPKARLWIEPAGALEWFRGFRDAPEHLVRPKKYSCKDHA